jgi:septal ring factor EnvC (AmiA/AmiB activator)
MFNGESNMYQDNTLASSINAFSVSPSRDQLITLTIGQLSDLITAAVEKAIQPLQDEVESFRATVARQDEKIAALESTQEQDVDRLAFDICQDRQRLARLESRPSTAPASIVPPRGEKSIARIAKLRDFLKARGGGATFQECERLLGIHPNQMTKLVSQLDKRSFEIFTRAGDDRQRVLRLKAQIVSRGFK